MTNREPLRESMAADKSMRAYNDATLRYYLALEHNAVEERQRENTLVILDEKGEQVEALYIRPVYERVDDALLAHKQPGESYKEYAVRMNLSAVELSQLRSPSNPRALSRDLLLNLLLKRKENGSGELLLADFIAGQAANTEERDVLNRVNHLFMELKMPDLYIRTFDREENHRNFIIAKVICAAAMALREGNHPDTDWDLLLQRALISCDLGPTLKDAKAAVRAQKLKGTPLPKELVAVGEELELMESWREELEEISAVDYTAFRRELLAGIKRAGETDVAAFTRLHSRLSGVTYDAVKGFFGSADPRRNKTGRHTLVRIGVAMGCTLAQINRMLRETNEACVYPLSSWDEERNYANHIASKTPL